jgi:glutamine amidotransferase
MIGIVDYGAGNLASVRNAFDHLGNEAAVCRVPEELAQYERVVLPGVGSFRSAMGRLDSLGWTKALRQFARTGKPFLGICLGMQLLFEMGDEHGQCEGIGLLPGKVVRLAPTAPCRIPHVGWNGLARIEPHPLLAGIKPQVDFYFVHSYQCVPSDASTVIATCDYGGEFVAVVGRENVVGMQFHPEKSQPSGMRILENFADWTPGC